jgi:hypothetical protein
MALFIRLTIIVALGIVALVALVFLIKAVFVAAIIAAIVVGGAFAVNFFRRRMGKAELQIVSRDPRRRV